MSKKNIMEFKTISEYPMYDISKNGIIRNRETKKIIKEVSEDNE